LVLQSWLTCYFLLIDLLENIKNRGQSSLDIENQF
jgi:hypothetical protein